MHDINFQSCNISKKLYIFGPKQDVVTRINVIGNQEKILLHTEWLKHIIKCDMIISITIDSDDFFILYKVNRVVCRNNNIIAFVVSEAWKFELIASKMMFATQINALIILKIDWCQNINRGGSCYKAIFPLLITFRFNFFLCYIFTF